MRALLSCAALVLAATAGCGSEERHANDDRPAPAINVTASILAGELSVSPTELGAGPVRMLVTNQTAAPLELTFETAGGGAGTTTSTPPIPPEGVATLQVAAAEGEYELRTSDRRIEPVAITVGAPRPSGQNTLLEP